ncbi:MAG: hypothetical protein ACREB3_04510, partial [Burkholderiales bacterium]
MGAAVFRRELRERLLQRDQTVLLRIAVSPHFDSPVEKTGRDIVREGEELAGRYGRPDHPGMELLLLPHSPELFLLHLGLVLQGRIPAILPWPTARIDAEKYQRNLLHQLRNLPAAQLITLPGLAENLGSGLPFPATACRIEGAERYEQLFSVPLVIRAQETVEKATGGTCPSPDALFLQ